MARANKKRTLVKRSDTIVVPPYAREVLRVYEQARIPVDWAELIKAVREQRAEVRMTNSTNRVF